MRSIDLSTFKNKKTALVLSGGVVKASAWHLGVALALEEMGFTLKNNNSAPSESEISTYVGSSAGALVSLYFAAGFRPLDIIEANLDKSHQTLKPITYRDMLSIKRPMKKPPKAKQYDPFDGLPLIIKSTLSSIVNISGFFSTEGLKEYIILNVLKEKRFFDELKSDLFIVATQLDHSRKVIFSKFNYPNPSHDNTAHYYTGFSIAETIAASMSVPPFYSPYPIKNPQTNNIDYYLDGEIRETLSTHVAIDNGSEYIISSWTHTPYHYHDEVGSLINYGLPAICIQAIYLIIQKKIIAARAHRNNAIDIIDTVNDYLTTNKFSNAHRSKIMSILERKLGVKKNVTLVDIFPAHENYKIFFRNSFSLDPKKTSEIVKYGYERTFEVFRRQEWLK
jgi:predicted acylesterase/phospholipase RssA